jgi:hypothetical protein
MTKSVGKFHEDIQNGLDWSVASALARPKLYTCCDTPEFLPVAVSSQLYLLHYQELICSS